MLMLVLLNLVSCTTSKTTVSQTADLSKYNYAVISDLMDYHGHAALMDAEIKICDAIDNSRLKLVGDREAATFSYEQLQQLLMVHFSVTQNEEESIVTVNFVDYLTGRPVASCRGAFGLGMDYDGDLNGAVKRLTSQIVKTFPKKK